VEGSNDSASRDPQRNISHQVEDAKDRSFTGMPFAQFHPHVAKDNSLLIGPSGGRGILSYIAKERTPRA
jgi:hypothetical protein